MSASRYVEENDSAAMVTAKRSAGIAPVVNIREHITHTTKLSANKDALKPRGNVTRSPKQGYEWPDKKDLCPPIFFVLKYAYPLILQSPKFTAPWFDLYDFWESGRWYIYARCATRVLTR